MVKSLALAAAALTAALTLTDVSWCRNASEADRHRR